MKKLISASPVTPLDGDGGLLMFAGSGSATGHAKAADAEDIAVCSAAVKMEPLMFDVFNQRIDAMPEGPVGTLNSPSWQRCLDIAGLLAMLGVGVLWLGLALGWLTPAEWMGTAARCLMYAAAALWLPGVVRSVWVVYRDMRKGTSGFMQQWDHDLALYDELQAWLATYPREHLHKRLQQCRQLQDGLQRKLGVFLGGTGRWGILPALVAVFYGLQAREKLLLLPGWLVLVGIGIVLFWVMGLNAQRAHLRLALMADLLEGSLRSAPPECCCSRAGAAS